MEYDTEVHLSVLNAAGEERSQELLAEVDDCVHCPSAVSYSNSTNNLTAAELRLLFHQACPQCSSSPSVSQNEGMCPTCQHLRFRHLVTCAPDAPRGRFIFSLKRGLIEEFDTKCPLCRLVKHMVLSSFDSERISNIVKADYGLVLYLAAPPKQASTIAAADIYLHYREENGVANVWVGDLHIGHVDRVKNLSRVGPMMSWVHLKPRIAQCYEEHNACRQKIQPALPQEFRVIDITRRRIVQRNDVPFLALSYVWGKDTRSSLLTATRATISAMKADDGLPMSEMPRTIEDAMAITNQLGEEYLWVDRLCIIQDDSLDKLAQIQAMSDIFSSARLVLVAAYGSSMDFGINGIRHPRSVVQHHEDISGLRVTNVVRDPEDDPLAVWHTRGWTYQEAVLARRQLVFTRTRAYFECSQSTSHEDAYNLDNGLNEFTSYELFMEEDNSSRFQAFSRHLKNYTSRNLSLRSDAYNAFTGITKALYDSEKNKSGFIYGLPQVDFDRALLWYTDWGKREPFRLETEGVICPTWSWSAVMNYLTSDQDPVLYQEKRQYGTLALWHVVNPPSADPSAGSPQLEAVNLSSETEMDDDWSLYMAIAVELGLLDTPNTLPSSCGWSNMTDTFSTIRAKFHARWASYLNFRRETLPSPLSPEWFQTTNALLSAIRPKGGTLLAVVQSCSSLHLREGTEWSGLNIIDSEDTYVGELCGSVTQLMDKEALSSLSQSTFQGKKTSHEFIALSLSGEYIRRYTKSEGKQTKNFFDVEGNPLELLPTVNVMMIGWRGKYAYRRELGWVYLKDWVKADREWKVIMLE